MGIMIGLTLAHAGTVQAQTPGSAHGATLSDLVVPQAGNVAIFDSGAARGANAANIPLSGTTDAPDGAQIEARIVRADTGAQVHGWVPVATAAGGLWSGDYPVVPRNANRLRAEVRPAGSSATPGTMATDFMVGHVIVLIGQSEDARMFAANYDRRDGGGAPLDGFYQSVPAFADANAADSFFLMTDVDADYATNGIIPINDTTPWTASTAHLANIATRNAPGEKFLFIEATASGTYRADLADSPDAGDDDRGWGSSFFDAIQIVRDWGGDVGVLMDTWTAADGTGYVFFDKFFPFISGLESDGSPYSLGTASNGLGATRWPNILFDLSGGNGGSPNVAFDEAVTRYAFHGPHRFEDSTPTSRENKQGTRLAIRDLVADPLLAPIMRPKGPEILLYQNGTPTDTPDTKSYNPDPSSWVQWYDASHPGDYTDDGLTARARHTGVAVLYALGIGPAAAMAHHVPSFNRADWEPSGAYVDLWYAAPDGSTPRLSTTRLERGDAAIPDSYPHRTEVAGFLINAAPAQRAEIVAGRVRVYPDPAGAFTYSDVIRYGVNGASGVVQWPEDEFDDIWKNLPLAVMGFEGIDGVAIEPLPDAADIANTLPAPASFTTSATGPYFQAPNGIGANTGQFTFAFKGSVDIATDARFFSLSGSRMSLTRQNNGQMRLILKDDSNTSVFQSGGVATLAANVVLGIPTEIVLSFDLPGQSARLWVDGVLTDDFTLIANTGALNTNRVLNLLGGAVGQLEGQVEYARYWRAYTATGDTTVLGTPAKDISGDAASVNADPWKSGDDAS